MISFRRIYSFALIFAMYISPMTYATDCKCVCRGYRSQPVCESVEDLWKMSNAHMNKLMEWERYRPFVERFSERWKKEITDIVESKLKEYIPGGNNMLPKPENLVSIAEDGIQNDFVMVSNPPDDNDDIVSDLIAKVEKVENRTMEVEEELKSERRVRRHLEQEVKETQSSLVFLGDQLQNVTVPVDAMMHQVQMVIFSSLEDMNKTYEDHLKKLYYKVDGVVYKNETKKLDERLEHVETELHDSENSSIVFKIAEDLRMLEETVNFLNYSVGETLLPRIEMLNKSIESVLIPKIESLRNESVQKDVVKGLEDKMASILNNTELFKSALIDVFSDIQDAKDFEKTFYNFSEEWSKSLKMLESQIEYLKNESALSKPIQQPDGVDELVGNFQQNVIHNFPEDSGTTEKDDYYENWDTEIDSLKVFGNDTLKIKDYTTTEIEVTPTVVTRYKVMGDGITEDLEHTTLEPEVTPSVLNVSKYLEDLVSESENSSLEFTTVPDVADRGKIGKAVDENAEPCVKPDVLDPHLLADVVTDSNGREKLKFGCRPIGSYVVAPLPVPPRCEMGEWRKPFPSCKMLAGLSKIESLANELSAENPCVSSKTQPLVSEFEDPTNCSQFFKCSHGRTTIMSCPEGLNFNPNLKVCDHARSTPCRLDENSHAMELLNLIPPIRVEPDNVDKPGSHLGTGTRGQLIVHPRSSFTLHCLYPENLWGSPTWNISYTSTEIRARELISEEGRNSVSLTVTAATEEDSGIYKCKTPFGLQHAVEVEVKVVVCPSFILPDDYEDAFYRPSPEGEIRIMGTSVEFLCEDGSRVTARCMADGSWSRGLPTEDECSLKKRNSDYIWNCEPIDLSHHPDLILERIDAEKRVRFMCAGRKRLIGNAYTRCRDSGDWTHSTLPRCK